MDQPNRMQMAVAASLAAIVLAALALVWRGALTESSPAQAARQARLLQSRPALAAPVQPVSDPAPTATDFKGATHR